MNVLGIETSCDETAAAVVSEGRVVLSNIVFSQIHLHRPYGGVVPEVASRNHLASLEDVVARAVRQSGLGWAGLEALAVTYGPGLASSLLVGLSLAQALALRLCIPLIGINHLEAHIYSPLLTTLEPAWPDLCPMIALVASGGHTSLIHVAAPGKYRPLGWTLDDAAGEAFDKGAKLLGLDYPGGPSIDRLSQAGDPQYISFPRGRVRSSTASDLCFSFSGLKTALLYYLRAQATPPTADALAHIAASYQEAIVDALLDRLQLAVTRERVAHVAVVGGVALNSRLRQKLECLARAEGVQLLLPRPEYCSDNAAMIAGLAGSGQGITGPRAWTLDVQPNLEIGETQLCS